MHTQLDVASLRGNYRCPLAEQPPQNTKINTAIKGAASPNKSTAPVTPELQNADPFNSGQLPSALFYLSLSLHLL